MVIFRGCCGSSSRASNSQPDAAILSVAAADEQFLIEHLRKALSSRASSRLLSIGRCLEQIIRKAGVHGKMPDAMIERRLQPYVAEIYEWAFHRFAQQCAQRGVRPLVIYRPAPADFDGVESASRSEMVRLARAAGSKSSTYRRLLIQ